MDLTSSYFIIRCGAGKYMSAKSLVVPMTVQLLYIHSTKKPVITMLTYPGNVQFYIVTTWETPGNRWC